MSTHIEMDLRDEYLNISLSDEKVFEDENGIDEQRHLRINGLTLILTTEQCEQIKQTIYRKILDEQFESSVRVSSHWMDIDKKITA